MYSYEQNKDDIMHALKIIIAKFFIPLANSIFFPWLYSSSASYTDYFVLAGHKSCTCFNIIGPQRRQHARSGEGCMQLTKAYKVE